MVWLVPDEHPHVPAMYTKLPNGDPHITLEYGVTREQAKNIEGTRYEFTAPLFCYDSCIQAINVVFKPGEAPICNNAYPHITVSMQPGVNAKQANSMFENIDRKVEFLPEPRMYTGTVKFIKL